VKSGSLKTVQLLLECGANITIRNNRGETPLHDAILDSIFYLSAPLLTLRESRQVVEDEVKYFTKHMGGKNSLLHLAALRGNEDVCGELIEKLVTDWGALTPEIKLFIAGHCTLWIEKQRKDGVPQDVRK
jgi:hypothetical protein